MSMVDAGMGGSCLTGYATTPAPMTPISGSPGYKRHSLRTWQGCCRSFADTGSEASLPRPLLPSVWTMALRSYSPLFYPHHRTSSPLGCSYPACFPPQPGGDFIHSPQRVQSSLAYGAAAEEMPVNQSLRQNQLERRHTIFSDPQARIKKIH